MKPLTLLGPVMALALQPQNACGQGTAAPHFVDMTASPYVFVRLPNDVEAATIRLDLPAIAALRPDVDEIIEVIVSYDADHKTAWRAEHDLDPRFESLLAARRAHGRLLATSTTAFERDYWFTTDDFAALASTLVAIPQPDGAAIAVLRETVERLNDLRPDKDEAAAAMRGAHP